MATRWDTTSELSLDSAALGVWRLWDTPGVLSAIKGAQDEFNFGADACLRCRLLTWCLRVVVEDMRAIFRLATRPGSALSTHVGCRDLRCSRSTDRAIRIRFNGHRTTPCAVGQSRRRYTMIALDMVRVALPRGDETLNCTVLAPLSDSQAGV